MKSAKSRLVKLFHFFTIPQEHSLSVVFLFVAKTARNTATDFLVFGEAAVTAPVDGFHCELGFGHFYRHTCKWTDRNYVCC